MSQGSSNLSCQIFVVLVAFSIMAITATDVSSAQLSTTVTKEGKVVVSLDGEITTGDADAFSNIVKVANSNNQFVSGIRLNSPGGNLAEGAKLAAAIKFAKIATVVPNDRQCASACFLAFAGGEQRYASRSARIGVHGASEMGAETNDATAATVGMVRLAKSLGVPDGILGEMAATPPDQVFWLSANDLLSMNVVLTGKPRQAVAEQPQSQTYPAPPQQTNPAPTQANVRPDWTTTVNQAAQISSSQYGGKPNIQRLCQPEIKTCTIAIYFTGTNKTPMMLRSAEDENGNVYKRDICEFNQFLDVRTCTVWESGTVTREMKDPQGNWQLIQ